ncbi:unnamed protein product, partial [Symbiodinium sp. KB8]
MTWNRMVTNQPRDTDDLDMTLDTIPARGDASSVATPAIADGPNAYQELTISQQFEASNLAQQMYYRSQVQEYEGIVQTLMDKIKEMQQEDEGSGIRIEELERQRDHACLAMRHINNVNQEMKRDYETALFRMDEQNSAQQRQAHAVAEELAQQLHVFRTEAATNFVQLEARAQGDGELMAREYERLTHELHEHARENLVLRSNTASSEQALQAMQERFHLVKNQELRAVNEIQGLAGNSAAIEQERFRLRERLGEEE